MAVKIRYKGVDIGTVEPGKTAKIKCLGKRMKTDILVESEVLKLQEKTLTANGVYPPDSGYDGFSKVTVNVAASGSVSITDDGEGNVTITTSGGVSITDDGNGNVVIA